MRNLVEAISEQPGHQAHTIHWTASVNDALVRMHREGVLELVVVCNSGPIGTLHAQDIHRHWITSLAAPGESLVSVIMDSNIAQALQKSGDSATVPRSSKGNLSHVQVQNQASIEDSHALARRRGSTHARANSPRLPSRNLA